MYSNPNLNNLQDPYARYSYYYWLEDLLAGVSTGNVQVASKSVTLVKDLAARLLVPFAARYLIFDSSIPGYRMSGVFEGDSSLRPALQADTLKMYELGLQPRMIRPAGATVKVQSDFDLLALSEALGMRQLAEVAFATADTPVGKQYGALSLDAYETVVNRNAGFEEVGPDGTAVGWALTGASGDVRLKVEEGSGSGGSRSLRVTNRAIRKSGMNRIEGDAVAVRPGEVYSVQSRVKYKNARWTQVTVEGYQEGTGQWIPIMRCPAPLSGEDKWRTYRGAVGRHGAGGPRDRSYWYSARRSIPCGARSSREARMSARYRCTPPSTVFPCSAPATTT